MRRIGALVVAALVVVSACQGGGDDEGARDDGAREGAVSGDAATTCPAPADPQRDVVYARPSGVDPQLVSLDIYPTSVACPAPVVIWVHGGGWRTGDKRAVGAKPALFNDAGYLLVSVNYRLTPGTGPEPVRYPVHNDDVAAAVAWVHDTIAEYGGDPDRIALLGHSAGAGIAAAVANDPRHLAAHDLGLDALDCVGPIDTEAFDVAARARQGGAVSAIYQAAFGTDPAVWEEASPLTHVEAGQGIPSTFLVERGTLQRIAQVRQYADALRAAGVEVSVVEAPTYSHAEVNQRIGEPGESVMTPPLMGFLATCFAST